MKTTSLFVELLVIGTGTLIWIILVLNALGIDTFNAVKPYLEYELMLTSLGLAVVYTLGIVTDRLADGLLSIPAKKIRSKIYPNRKKIIIDKVEIYNNATPLVDMIDYGRSRLRICRGWILNLFFILSSGNWNLWKISEKNHLIIFNIFMVVLLLGLYYAWSNLAQKEYEKIKNISTALRS
jgi:hypothetical protein